MFREWMTLEHLVLNVMSLFTYSPQGSGINLEEEVERLWDPEVMDDSEETAPSRCK